MFVEVIREQIKGHELNHEILSDEFKNEIFEGILEEMKSAFYGARALRLDKNRGFLARIFGR